MKKKIRHVRRVVISCPDTDTDPRGPRCRRGQQVHNAAVKMLAYEIAQALVIVEPNNVVQKFDSPQQTASLFDKLGSAGEQRQR